MSNLKIKRSATTGQSSLAKVSGRSLSIQDNNVHPDKGKNVACPIGQPIISYKEMLRKEPTKNSMEVITGVEVPAYLRGPYAGKEDITGATTKNIATPIINSTSHKVQNTETKPCQNKDSTRTQDNHKRLEKNSENVESETESEEAKTSRIPVGPQKGQGVQDAEDIKSIEDSEGIEDIEDVENLGNIEDMEDIENIEDIEDMEDIENIEDDAQKMVSKLENQKSSLQKPKNGKTLSCNAITLPREFMATTWVQREDDARGAVPILLAEDEECRDIENDLIAMDVSVSGFTGGATKTKGVIPIEVKVGSKVATEAFFVVNTDSAYNALLGRDWIHSNWVVPSSLHQFAECSIQPRNGQGIMGQEQISTHPIRMDDIKEEVQDPLIEINLGTKEDPRVTFVSGHLGPEEFNKITMILKEYKDCFAWDYPELPGLSSKLVEHRLPIKEGFQPFQQTPRRMAPDITLKIKEKIERLVRAGFIRPAMYVEWLSNIVPVLKKNGKLRICIDFRNINMATPKDEYPMPIADLLVDGASGYKILSFMDEHSGKAFIRMRKHQLKMNPLALQHEQFKASNTFGCVWISKVEVQPRVTSLSGRWTSALMPWSEDQVSELAISETLCLWSASWLVARFLFSWAA
uniref:Reverse transcriptase domain-containing protein n=1 Tax=Fagus sylvatica TaxID=28930 RepID=A0A2N9F0K1_FAGSY